MKSTLHYLWLTAKHKYFVFCAGLKVGVPLWLLIIHDWSKFLPCECVAYGKQFFGQHDDPLGFSYAWNHHQKSNKHHWEYWVMTSGHNRGGFPDGSALPMPDKYVREMVADWLGASRAYEGQWPKDYASWKWFDASFTGINLHPKTRLRVIELLDGVFMQA